MSKMNVLLIGSGGREHALAWKIAQSPSLNQLFVAPGNGGTETGNDKIKNVNLSKFEDLVDFAVKNDVKLVVPGPEQPLVDGINDYFKKVGIPCFGPSAAAARMEGSKAFSKDFMKRHNIPTAEYETFTDYEKAKEYMLNFKGEFVIKASGLAAGKGVLLPESMDEAIEGLKSIMLDSVFGSAGSEVVIEERLTGQELSCLAFSDGYSIVPLPSAQDHKRALEGDKGLNTGGMGCYAPTPIASPELLDTIRKTVLQPTIDGMRRDGFPFVGILYAGLMLTPNGPKVLEYNCRFGDPETEVLLPLLDEKTDLVQVLLAAAEGRLDSVYIGFRDCYAATVVAASKGYPEAYPKGLEITIGTMPEDVTVFHAGTKVVDGKLVTSGGRVLTVTGVAPTLQEALNKAYEGLAQIHFDGMHIRRDIGHRALKFLAEKKEATHTTYADAGVSITNGDLFVQKIKAMVKSTVRTGADAEIGGFGGTFDLKPLGYKDPILVSGTDGVGTKLKIAENIGIHDTVGIDLVAMSVNDLIVQGAEPLFFLDYFATSKLDVDVGSAFVSGIANACKESGCALIGGETAEMPGFYAPGEYDAAGFCVGIVEREKLLPRINDIKVGDVVLGLASSGIHSNGFSLVRHIVEKNKFDYNAPSPFAENQTLGQSLITPTRLYVKPLLDTCNKGLIKGLAHITGGGFIENIPRVLPKNTGVVIDAASYPLPPVFKWLKKNGNIEDLELARTFNCGIGMVVICDASKANEVIASIKASGEKEVYTLGSVVDRESTNGGKPVVINNMETAWAI
eukprot:jgi/Orpsp1_1/1176444/evm.model.c7180000057611.2